MIISGNKSVSEVIQLLKKLPNQNTIINCLSTFGDNIFITNDEHVIIIEDTGEITVLDNDPELFDNPIDEMEITPEIYDSIVNEFGILDK